MILKLSGKKGLKQIKSIDEKLCDISIGSDSLNYCFKELWGGDTLNVNGRFQICDKRKYKKFRDFGNISSNLNRREDFPVQSKIQRLNNKIKRLFA
jgi:hypothetical protein